MCRPRPSSRCRRWYPKWPVLSILAILRSFRFRCFCPPLPTPHSAVMSRRDILKGILPIAFFSSLLPPNSYLCCARLCGRNTNKKTPSKHGFIHARKRLYISNKRGCGQHKRAEFYLLCSALLCCQYMAPVSSLSTPDLKNFKRSAGPPAGPTTLRRVFWVEFLITEITYTGMHMKSSGNCVKMTFYN